MTTDLFAQGMPPEKAADYHAQIARQRKRAKKWFSENPTERVEIVWPKMAVIATISDALRAQFVTANTAGLKLISPIIAGETENDEPTISMVRASIE